MQLINVILKPYLTEKTSLIRESNTQEVVTFIVDHNANKCDIRKAFEAIYNIKPEKVNTLTRKPVQIKTGTRNPGWTKLEKIAYITLPEGVKLAITKQEIEEAKETLKEEEKKVVNKKQPRSKTKQ